MIWAAPNFCRELIGPARAARPCWLTWKVQLPGNVSAFQATGQHSPLPWEPRPPPSQAENSCSSETGAWPALLWLFASISPGRWGLLAVHQVSN